ncbi:hypothetical protein D3C85_1888560 [compost metagenome]
MGALLAAGGVDVEQIGDLQLHAERLDLEAVVARIGVKQYVVGVHPAPAAGPAGRLAQ